MIQSAAIQGQIRLMTADDLHLVLSWRNHPNIRRYMYTQNEITMAEHQRWFEQASQNAYKHLLIYTSEDGPAGFVQLCQLKGTPIADWGFYAAPDASKGGGRRLGYAALKYAFEHLGLHKICGQALAYNDRSVHLHRALGFQQEGLLRDHWYDGKIYYDVVCFGLLRPEWQQDQ